MAKININFDEKVYSIHKEVLEPATDALKAHLGTLGGGNEGGTLDYDKEVKFKEVITMADCEAYANNATPKSNDGSLVTYFCFSSNPNAPAPPFLSAVIGADFATFMCMPSTMAIYFYACNAEKCSEVDGNPQFAEGDGWYAIGQDGSEQKTTAPTITISEGVTMAADLATTAIFFDLGGNEGDLDITLDGAVYKVDSTKLAPATNSLIAHLETLKGGESGGGVPKFGTDWKFKDVITPDEIKAVASHYTPNEIGVYSIRWEESLGLQVTIMDLDAILPQLAPDFVAESKMGTLYQVTYNPWTTYTGDIWFYTDRSELTDYGAEIYSQLMSGGMYPPPPQGWIQGPDSTTVVETGPTIPNVTEDLGINPAYVAPLFDVPGGGGGSGTLEYGKEYQFKKDITVDDFEYYFENATDIGHPTNGVDMASIAMNEDYTIGAVAEQIYYTQYPDRPPVRRIEVMASDGALFLFTINGFVPEEEGWVKVEINEEDGTEIRTPIDTPPTVTIPEGAEMSADLATTAVFFDIPSAGGTLEFGTDWKFKDVITPADFEAVMANYECEEEDIFVYCTPYSGEDFLISIEVANLSVIEPDAGKVYNIRYDPRTGRNEDYCFYFCPSNKKAEEIYAEEIGAPTDWFNVWTTTGGSNIVVMDTPPTIASVSADTGINTEYIAPFFDVPGGGSGNEGDTKIVINGAEYWVDSAKLADAKRALAAHLKALEDASN